MTWSLVKGRRRRWIFGSVGVGVFSFVCAIHWDIGPLVLAAVFAFTAATLLALPVRICESCGDGVIQVRRGPRLCSKCNSASIAPAWGLFSTFGTTRRLAFEIPLALVLLSFSPRLLCMGVFALHILLAIFVRSQWRTRWLNGTTIAFLVLLLLPFDIEIGGFHGSHYGVARSGPRFVRLVMGKPRIQRCIEKYGEFIAGGCMVMGNEPEWLFVWERAGLSPSKSPYRRGAEGPPSRVPD